MAVAILSERISRTPIVRAALYARVSTANNGQDPTMQTRELREYSERRGWQVVGEYVDVGISGTKEKRPELDRLVSEAHSRRFDVVVLWKFDRFARSVSHLLRALETFRALGMSSSVSASRWTRAHRPARWSLLCWGLWPSWSAA
jgi:DNA invertase Pin-like site-specific DNA recombinase